jgi:glycosyltransferase involved in cell wall biosynthesis
MRIASVVLNNFVNDNRVYKVADSLTRHGHQVTIVALLKGDVPEFENYHGIPVHRIVLRSMKLSDNNKLYGAIKFLEFFLKVMWHYRKCDIIHCNDFEGFMAGVMVKISRPRVKLVYDSHEYQKEKYGLPPFMKRVIGLFERLFIRWSSVFITVSPSIAEEYKRIYGIRHPYLVLNAPHYSGDVLHTGVLKEKLGLDQSTKLFIYQGGFAKSRGIEVLIESFSQERFSMYHIVFMGSGPLKSKIATAAELHPNIHLLPPVPYKDLIPYTASADAGFVSTQNLCLNNFMCMPNKLFEYLHAEIPVLTNNLVECSRIAHEENSGVVIEEYSPDGIWNAIHALLQRDREVMISSIRRAKKTYCWEVQEKVLLEAYSTIGA